MEIVIMLSKGPYIDKDGVDVVGTVVPLKRGDVGPEIVGCKRNDIHVDHVELGKLHLDSRQLENSWTKANDIHSRLGYTVELQDIFENFSGLSGLRVVPERFFVLLTGQLQATYLLSFFLEVKVIQYYRKFPQKVGPNVFLIPKVYSKLES